MTRRRAYLDWNATAPILPEVAEAAGRALALGNPSSVHAEGRAARAAVEQARMEVAALVGAEAGQVTFTSGGTEAAVMALRPSAAGSVLAFGAAEHACIREGGLYAPEKKVEIAALGDSRFDFEAFRRWVNASGLTPNQVQVALQAANNETGAVNDFSEACALREQGFPILCDAVQAAGRIPVDVDASGADALFISAHKIGGPKGVGAIVARKDACGGLAPLIRGGGQEKGLRGGTENVAGIVGFGVAARVAKARLSDMARIAALRDAFERDLLALAPDATIFAANAPRLPNTSLFAIPGLRAETALIAFDLDGVAVSNGSACSSGKVGKSHVLAAMGVSPALAASSIRVSLGWTSERADLDQCLESIERQMKRVLGRQSAA